jgi:hypothetical protein
MPSPFPSKFTPPTNRSRDLIIRMQPEAIQPRSRLYYPEPVLSLLARFLQAGMEHLEVYWPVGLTVFPSVPPPNFVPLALRDIVSWIASREVRKLCNLDPLSEPFKREARLHLRARFRTNQEAVTALGMITTPGDPSRASIPAIHFAELVVQRSFETPVPNQNPGAKLDESSKLWGKSKLAPHPDWLQYKLANMAILDSGCEISHPTFAAGAVTLHGSQSDVSGHGTFVAGQLIGRGGGALPKNHGMLPRSRVWVGNVADPKSAKINFDVEPSVYDTYLHLLTRTNESEWIAAGLNKFNIKVVNLSLGGLNHSALEEMRVNDLLAKGIAVVACVHNITGIDPTNYVYYPAALPSVISVGAVMENGTGLALWSASRTQLNYKDWVIDKGKEPAVDLCAPGVSIFSSMPAQLDGSASLDGTSFAAPFVTAAMAVLAAANPTIPPAHLAKSQLFLKVVSQSIAGTGRGLLRCNDIRIPLKILLGDSGPAGHGEIDPSKFQI